MASLSLNTQHAVIIPNESGKLHGLLCIPTDAKSIVLFVHGSGSSRLSIRNQHVAQALNVAKQATLLFDLLTESEDEIDEQTREFRFDISLLATRLLAVTDWCLKQPALEHFSLGYFGASTGAGATLMAAATEPNLVKAIVSRGGRPDLAGDTLPYVQAPTLLIVGGEDPVVIDLNKQAQTQMTAITQLNIVPGATHLFEEPGKLDEVARLAIQWFNRYL